MTLSRHENHHQHLDKVMSQRLNINCYSKKLTGFILRCVLISKMISERLLQKAYEIFTLSGHSLLVFPSQPTIQF